MSKIFSVKDKVVVIPGAAGILGSVMVRHFAAEGAKVVILDRALEPAEKLAAEVRAAGGEATALFCDVLDADDPGGPAGHEVGYRSSSGVQIVYRFITGQSGELARHFVKFVSLRRVGLVERSGADLESQSLHLFENMVASGPQPCLLIAERVVELGVDYVHERGYLRERLPQMIHQRGDANLVGLGEDHDHHHLTGGGSAYHHVAHQARVLADVIEFVAVFDAKPPGLEADGVRRVGLKPAFPNVENLVEHSRHVETECRLGPSHGFG